jgi:uncharacterized protein YjbJ (UPF0337 family)
MNENQIEGAAKVIGGKFQRVAGDVLDDPRMRAGGAVREGVGHVQETAGSVQEVLGQAVDHALSAATKASDVYGQVSGSARDIVRNIEEKPLLAVVMATAAGLLAGLLLGGRGPKVIYVKPRV